VTARYPVTECKHLSSTGCILAEITVSVVYYTVYSVKICGLKTAGECFWI